MSYALNLPMKLSMFISNIDLFDDFVCKVSFDSDGDVTIHVQK